MTASDCFELGMQLYLGKKFQFATAWFEEALVRIDDGSLDVSEEYILSQLSHTHYANGR